MTMKTNKPGEARLRTRPGQRPLAVEQRPEVLVGLPGQRCRRARSCVGDRVPRDLLAGGAGGGQGVVALAQSRKRAALVQKLQPK